MQQSTQHGVVCHQLGVLEYELEVGEVQIGLVAEFPHLMVIIRARVAVRFGSGVGLGSG